MNLRPKSSGCVEMVCLKDGHLQTFARALVRRGRATGNCDGPAGAYPRPGKQHVAKFVRASALCFLISALAIPAQPLPPELLLPVATNEPPPFYTLAWTPGVIPGDGFVVRTNGVTVADIPPNQTAIAVTNPVGRFITNTVLAYFDWAGNSNSFSPPAILVWTNVYWVKPMTNIVTLSTIPAFAAWPKKSWTNPVESALFFRVKMTGTKATMQQTNPMRGNWLDVPFWPVISTTRKDIQPVLAKVVL